MTLHKLHKISKDAFNKQDAGEVSRVYAVDAVISDPHYPEPLLGRDAVCNDYEQLFRSFPDIKAESIHSLVNKNSIAYIVELNGTNDGPISTPKGDIPPTHRPMKLQIAVFAETVKAGLYKNVRRYYNIAGQMRQLGLAR